jgi:hypothetical protein
MQKRSLLAAVAAAALATGCGSGKLLGDHKLPDETQVIDGPGLVLPPDYDLRPPRDAADYEAVLRAQKGAEAQTLITGVSGTVTASGTVAEDSWVVRQAGVAQPGIRQALSSEADIDKAKDKKDEGLFHRWFSGWGAKDDE